ncbi:hypothetical protein IT570_14030 [Candidatus Sumerlaeota bacterium]|nr:hypothetical protein [Candidatus Sumerlaeota bacterium]
MPRLVAAGRLPHAILLTGPDAIGKRSLAFAMAKAILSIPRGTALGAFANHLPEREAAPPQDDRATDAPDENPEPTGDDLFGAAEDPFPGSPDEDDLFGGSESHSTSPSAGMDRPARAVVPPANPPPASSHSMFPIPAFNERVSRLIESSYPAEYNSDGIPKNAGHVDFTVIEPAGGRRSILVDQIRHLRDATAVSPMEGAYRVAIVLGADTITAEGGNSILKLLEEPPRYLILILVANRLSRVLPTIRSRCSIVPMVPMNRAVLAERLSSEEQLDSTRAQVASALSEGRPGVAITMLESALLDRRKEIFSARLQIDRVGRAATPHAAARIISTGKLDESLWMLASFARDRLVRTLVPAHQQLLIHGDTLDLIDGVAATPESLDAEADRLVRAFGLLAHPYLPNPRAALETTLWPD